jgi:hypothetical protein
VISAAVVAMTACGGDGSARAEADGADTAVAPASEAVSPAELRATVSDEQVRRFYEGRGWRPAWTGETGAQLSSALDGAERHGLHRGMFLDPRSATGTAARREAALTKAAIAYAEAIAAGRTDPTKIRGIYTRQHRRCGPRLLAGR